MKQTITSPGSVLRLIVAVDVAVICIEKVCANESANQGHLGRLSVSFFEQDAIPKEFVHLFESLNDPEVLQKAGFTMERTTGFLWWRKKHSDVVPINPSDKSQVIAYLRAWSKILSDRFTSEGLVECLKCGDRNCEGTCRDSVPAGEHLLVMKAKNKAEIYSQEVGQALAEHKQALEPFARIPIEESEAPKKEIFSGVTVEDVRLAGSVSEKWKYFRRTK